MKIMKIIDMRDRSGWKVTIDNLKCKSGGSVIVRETNKTLLICYIDVGRDKTREEHGIRL